MKGYQGKTPDIYDDVVDFLKREINSLTDENTEIVVLPFQERILENWIVKASKAGKKEIINKIDKYNNKSITNTNIVQPVKTAHFKKLWNRIKLRVLFLTILYHYDTAKRSLSRINQVTVTIRVV